MNNKLIKISLGLVLAITLIAAAIPALEGALGTGESMINPVNVTAAYVSGTITLDPADPAWAAAPEATASLDMRATEWRISRVLGYKMARVPDDVRRLVKVRAVHNGKDIFFRYQWKDPTNDSVINETNRFADALAMSIPFNGRWDIMIHMGSYEPNNPGYNATNIIQWRADRAQPQNLVAAGEFTIQKTADAQNIQQYQKWANGVWTVVITRPMLNASANQVSFVRGAKYPIAFANWNGGIDGERNGNKLLTGAYQTLIIQ